MLIDYLLVSSSLFAISGVAMLAYGYRASLFSGDPATRWFAWSMALLCASIFWRRATWDLINPIVIAGQVDQRHWNIAFNVLCIAGVYAGLQARLLLIPQAERWRWHWFTCWMHPGLLRFRTDRPVAPHEDRQR